MKGCFDYVAVVENEMLLLRKTNSGKDTALTGFAQQRFIER